MERDTKDEKVTTSAQETCGASRVLGAAYQTCIKARGHEGVHQSKFGDTWKSDHPEHLTRAA
jgi:hypothetical protein